jgi:hypothetical protein
MQNGSWSPDAKRVLAGRFGATLELDPQARTPVTNPQEAAAVHAVSGLFCNAWTAGPDGGLAACDLSQKALTYEVAVYSPSERRLERTGVRGRSVTWAPATTSAELHRGLLFADGAGCFLYDRMQKSVTTIFSVAPNFLLAVAPSPNGKYIYFSRNIRDSDLWLARLAK